MRELHCLKHPSKEKVAIFQLFDDLCETVDYPDPMYKREQTLYLGAPYRKPRSDPSNLYSAVRQAKNG